MKSYIPKLVELTSKLAETDNFICRGVISDVQDKIIEKMIKHLQARQYPFEDWKLINYYQKILKNDNILVIDGLMAGEETRANNIYYHYRCSNNISISNNMFSLTIVFNTCQIILHKFKFHSGEKSEWVYEYLNHLLGHYVYRGYYDGLSYMTIMKDYAEDMDKKTRKEADLFLNYVIKILRYAEKVESSFHILRYIIIRPDSEYIILFQSQNFHNNINKLFKYSLMERANRKRKNDHKS